MHLYFARKVVDGVMFILIEQLNNVETLTIAPIKAMEEEVLKGVWKGEGAEAFVKEVATVAVPSLRRVAESINQIHTNINLAIDILDRADKDVLSIANALSGIFHNTTKEEF